MARVKNEPGEPPQTERGAQSPLQSGRNEERAKYRIWAAHCPFRKNDSPVLGTFGRSVKPVVVMTMATWKQLCVDVPQLQTTMFEVGALED